MEVTLLQARQSKFDTTLVRLRAQPGVNRRLLVDIEAQYVKLQQEYNVTLTSLRTINEELAALATGEPRGIKEIQSLFPSHTTLLAYFQLDDTTIAAFVLSRTQFEVVELRVDSTALHNFRESFYLFAALDTAYPQSLVDLHRSLITPLLKRITTPNVFIVPHGMLHYVPFAALTDGTTYLGDRFHLAILPSVSTLPYILQKRKNQTTLPPPLIFGNPATARRDLPPLRFAEGEAARLGTLYKVSPLVRQQATAQALFTRSSGAGIVHLAAHGRFNTSEPLESFIALAPDAQNQHDGRLTVREVYNNLRLTQADLVVLSACQTN